MKNSRSLDRARAVIYVFCLLLLMAWTCMPANKVWAQNVPAAPEYIFTTIDDTTVSISGGRHKATVLIFGRTVCSNTSFTLSDVAKSNWVKNPDIQVIFAEINQASKEAVQEYAARNASSDIISCYDTGTVISSAAWEYVNLYLGNANTVTLPVTVLLDENNGIRDVCTGVLSANDIASKISQFVDIGSSVPDSSGVAAVQLKIRGTEDYVLANQVYQLVNQERNAKGLPSLHYDHKLTETAMQRAAECAIYFSHLRPDGSDCFSVFPRSGNMAENIAAGSITAEQVMTGWVNSSGHYANIMSEDMTNIGVGCFIDENGTYYWVQCFDNGSDYTEPGATNHAVERVILTGKSLVQLVTDKNRTISCNDETSEIMMKVRNVNADWTVAQPVLEASLFNFWSSDPAVASVDASGRIVLNRAGTAVITAVLKEDPTIFVSWTVEKKDHQTVTTEKKSYCSSCGTVFWEKKDDTTDTQEPVTDTQKPVTDTQKPVTDTQRPVTDIRRPITDIQRPEQSAQEEEIETETGSYVQQISVSYPKTIKAGKSAKLKAKVKLTGDGTGNKKLKWKSSNKKYATVDQNGKVKTKKAGKGKTVTITVSSTDGTNIKVKVKIKIK